MIAVVTAFVPIAGHPRPPSEYHRLALALADLGVPVLAPVEPVLEQCWLYQHLLKEYDLDSSRFTYSTADNPDKNSLAYHIVQAQKSEFMLEVADGCPLPVDVYVWLDYGIFHVPGVTVEVVRDFLARVEGERAIAIPGCWGSDYEYDDDWPCWRFCGGVMVVPKEYLYVFATTMRYEYIEWLDRHRNVSWEVNTLARVERNWHLPLWWYGPCDHDASMFTKYRQTERADRVM
jgi:hypothetical protein